MKHPFQPKQEERPAAHTVFGFECVVCADEAKVLHGGISYCRKCMTEALRTGK